MTKEDFKAIFKEEIYPFVNDICMNNAFITVNDQDKCIDEIYRNYKILLRQYKEHIFPIEDDCLLDRHRVASCICGAVLRTSVFDTKKLLEQIKRENLKLAVVFYYVNEIVALYAGCRFLSFFMAFDGDDELFEKVLKYFPIMPNVMRIKKGFWNCTLFNLYQIKNDKQIGLQHYDLYAYAMFFFQLEHDFKNVYANSCAD